LASTANWKRIAEILTENSFLMDVVDFWGHNDADMLEIGNGALTAAEYRTHFAFWAAIKSPLIIGTNLAKLSSDNLAIIKNTYLIDFNQDATYGKAAKPYKWGTVADWTFDNAHPAEYWSGQSTKGVLVLMLNTGSATATRTATWSEVPELTGTSYDVTDIWTGKSLGCVKTGISRSLVTHDTAGFLVGKSC
jgi:alpha-galactosidase